MMMSKKLYEFHLFSKWGLEDGNKLYAPIQDAFFRHLESRGFLVAHYVVGHNPRLARVNGIAFEEGEFEKGVEAPAGFWEAVAEFQPRFERLYALASAYERALAESD